MLTEQRKQLLLDRLARDGRIVAKELSAELRLSEDTIRRDLRELAGEGRLTRVHGGALPASPTVANIAARRSMATDEKSRLGRKAASLIQRRQRVFIDGGTTHLELVRALPLGLDFTVITHSPTIAAALEPHQAVEVILIGGRLFRHSMVAVGAEALEQIQRLRIDLGFVGLTGLHPEEGGTTGDFEEAAIKRAMIARSAETVVLVTAEKLGAVSAFNVCAMKDLTSIVVTRETEVKAFAGVEIIRA
ncbi:DeoR/GlpR family DNA-binding transcription regulator [Aestuariivirga sp. YIM B02566]|uniref:DeoR/GlpR transcriptional regulator n=1 Tax=Taklimakanibacter albus TaxID=2800327 RepID=A0ACC5R350_9HYPH|nr:DeoR/GlpR family DNA-binding transcription regulator [Aestuariivirga sp. YIM B02566]MBK1867017.1 DeoR/GlpR transcriptional regulator [Aestuariivirga sp. YIM B02566]